MIPPLMTTMITMMVLELEYGSAATGPLLSNHGICLRAFPLPCITYHLWRRQSQPKRILSIMVM